MGISFGVALAGAVFGDEPSTPVFVDASVLSLVPWAWAGEAEAAPGASAGVATRIPAV